MASFASLNKAITGLMSNQRALNTTAHNLSNVKTPGYVRQQVIFKDSTYTKLRDGATSTLQVGMGTDIQTIRQIRDIFLDEAYRTEVGKQAFYQTQFNAVSEIEELFGEIQGVTFSEVLDNLREGINTLNEPDKLEARGTFVQSCVAFLERSNLIIQGLSEYQINLNQQVVDMADEINELGNKINTLNDTISKYELLGDNANDYRDERNNALDRLAELVNISYYEDANKKVSVTVEGMPFVSDNHVAQISLEQATPMSPMVKPVWVDYGIDMFNFDREISSENGNDIGALKGILLARGSSVVNYTDKSNVADYEKYIEPSAIMNIQAQFDDLVHGIVTMINEKVAPTTYDPLIPTSAPFGLNGSQGNEIFKRIGYDRYDAVGYIPEDPADVFSLYSAGNLVINPVILEDYNKIPLNWDKEKPGDNTLVQDMLTAWNTPFLKLKSTDTVQLSVNSFYRSMTSEVAHFGQMANNIKNNQSTMVNQINNQRSQIMGVSSDEELNYMMQYQHAYNASARVVTVVDEMIEQIVTRLGIVGR